jgi:hypothetical protein
VTATTSRKNCRGGRSHTDAKLLVEYIFTHGGSVKKTNEEIAFDLGFVISHGGGMRQVDTSRFVQARNHVKDGVVANAPCTGYRLHYRTSASGSEYTLIDPSGSLGHHAKAVIETIRGWAVREAQHHTENLRQTETFEALGDHALAQGDKHGYRLCNKASIEIERDGTVSPTTLAEINVWMSTL